MKGSPDEFIGCDIIVASSSNKHLENTQGKIIDETKHTFRIITDDNKEKTIMKKGNTFKINNKTFPGDQLEKRPEERIKG